MARDRERELEKLCKDAIAVVIGWGQYLNELAGHLPNDFDFYPMATAEELVDRMHGLGFGFGSESEGGK